MNAQDLYSEKQEAINDMLQRLTACMEAHNGKHAIDKENFGYVGDLSAVEYLLSQAVATLGGMGEGEQVARGVA